LQYSDMAAKMAKIGIRTYARINQRCILKSRLQLSNAGPLKQVHSLVVTASASKFDSLVESDQKT